MEQKIWLLQLFAESISGVTSSADAGQGTAGDDPARAEDPQVAAAGNTRLTWEQIMADPEYNRQMQAVIRARLKAFKAGSTRGQFVTDPGSGRNTVGGHSVTMAQNGPAVRTEAGSTRGQFVTDPGSGRNTAGGHSVTMAQNGPAVQSAHGQLRQENDRRMGAADARIRQHYDSLVQQEGKLQQVFPGFRLEQALRDPTFLRLTAPHVGVSVADAYYLLHRKEHQGAAMQLAAKRTAQKLSNAIRSGAHRPMENGTASQAPIVTGFNYANASLQQRQALKNAIRLAGSRGEKLYPENFR